MPPSSPYTAGGDDADLGVLRERRQRLGEGRGLELHVGIHDQVEIRGGARQGEVVGAPVAQVAVAGHHLERARVCRPGRDRGCHRTAGGLGTVVDHEDPRLPDVPEAAGLDNRGGEGGQRAAEEARLRMKDDDGRGKRGRRHARQVSIPPK
jgi:hypothetical protein